MTDSKKNRAPEGSPVQVVSRENYTRDALR